MPDTASRASSEGPDETDVPPMVTCAVCRRQDCTGCEAVVTLPLSATSLAWEGKSGNWMRRLWFTALASSTEPGRTFGELPDGRLGPALAFALLAETFAVGSLGSLAALSALALAPELTARILSTPAFLAAAGGLVLGLSLVMVGLHLLWGLCLELGAGSTGGTACFRHGMRFGLYACGWDLLTSPAGVLEGLLSRGFVDAWQPIVQAVRVPRAALRAYVEDCRHLDGSARRRGTQLSIVVLGAMLLLILVAVLVALLYFTQYLG
jgi:hypothetical protein